MIPEPLINIRSYTGEDEAYADLDHLHRQGVVAYVLVSKGKGGDGSIRLRVPESIVAQALEVLGPGPESTADQLLDDPDGEYACPRCRSTRAKALPPYYLVTLGAFVAAGTWLASQQQWTWAVALTVIGSLALHRIGARAHHWRCLNCGHAWNHDAEKRRRADARRNAPD